MEPKDLPPRTDPQAQANRNELQANVDRIRATPPAQPGRPTSAPERTVVTPENAATDAFLNPGQPQLTPTHSGDTDRRRLPPVPAPRRGWGDLPTSVPERKVVTPENSATDAFLNPSQRQLAPTHSETGRGRLPPVPAPGRGRGDLPQTRPPAQLPKSGSAKALQRVLKHAGAKREQSQAKTAAVRVLQKILHR